MGDIAELLSLSLLTYRVSLLCAIGTWSVLAAYLLVQALTLEAATRRTVLHFTETITVISHDPIYVVTDAMKHTRLPILYHSTVHYVHMHYIVHYI